MKNPNMAAIALMLIIGLPILLGFAMNFEEVETESWESTQTVPMSGRILNAESPYSLDYLGPQNNTLRYEQNTANFRLSNWISTSSTYSTVPVESISYHDNTRFEGGVYTNLADTVLGAAEKYVVTRSTNFNVDVKIIYNDGQEVTDSYTGIRVLSRIGGTVEVSTLTEVEKIYYNVRSVLLMPSSALFLNLWEYSAGSTYVNLSEGWAEGASIAGTRWANGYVNYYVRFMLDLSDNDGTCDFTAISNDGTRGTTVSFTKSSGSVTVNSQTLGQYRYVMVEFAPESTTVSGISDGWPTMGELPTAYNTLTFNNTGLEDIVSISMHSDNLFANGLHCRVDLARIQGGTFPSTKDCLLDLNALFPNTSYLLKINSVGVYGDLLQIGSFSSSVSEGSITISGQKIPIRGMEIKCLYDENSNEFVTTVSGLEVDRSGTPASLYLGGEWSMTLTYFVVQKVPTTETVWVAGGYGLSEDGTIVVALIVDGAVFLGLGFYGRRSGVKVGWLLVVCGLTAFVLIAML